MGAFDRIYSDEQREAAERTYVPHKVTANKVAELAASGQLKRPDGTTLDPFKISPHTVRKLYDRARQQSLGQVESPLANMEPRDSMEIIRRRLINVADAELRSLERQPRGKRDLERLRQVARCAREAAAIPGPSDPRPAKPGSYENGHRAAGATAGGLAGSILHAARGGTAQNAPTQQEEDGETDTAGSEGVDVAQPDHARDHAQDAAQPHAQPGSRASQLRSVAHALA